MAFPYLTIFLEGTHRTSDAKKAWSSEDIDTIIQSTQAFSADKIPFVAQTKDGKHPRLNLPIFGYADKNTLRKTTVNGRAALEIQPVEFADGLLEGLRDTPLNKMSVSLNKPHFNLEHICFVERPAVQDVPPLTNYEFSEDPDRIELMVDFADYRVPAIGSMLRTLRDWFINKFGLDEANKAIPDWGMDELKQYLPEVPEYVENRLSAVEGSSNQAHNFSEEEMDEMEKLRADFSAMQQQLTEASVQFSEYKTSSEQREQSLRAQLDVLRGENERITKDLQRKECADFCDELIRDGRLLPAEREFTIDDLMFKKQSTSKYQFSDGEADPATKTMEMLKSRPKMALFSQSDIPNVGGKQAQFSLDENDGRAALTKKAKEIAEQKNISFSAALQQIIEEQNEVEV